jgi:serine/threonine-protein kinase
MSTTQPETLIEASSRQFGPYLLERELGRGGMAVVFRAIERETGRALALKILPRQFTHDPQFRLRFKREAEAIAGLMHPAVVPVVGFGEHEDQPYIAMQLMAGGTLADRMQGQPMESDAIVQLVERVASALDAAHSRGLVHRDIKPSNILFDEQGRAFLADFGVAKLSEATAATTTSMFVGTPAYMSPEQAAGKALDGRSDVYGLAVVVFQLLSGQLPYEADTPVGLAVAQIVQPVPAISQIAPHLPRKLDKVLKRGLAKSPAERYPTAAALARDLRQLVIDGRLMSAAAGPDGASTAARQRAQATPTWLTTGERLRALGQPQNRWRTFGLGAAALGSLVLAFACAGLVGAGLWFGPQAGQAQAAGDAALGMVGGPAHTATATLGAAQTLTMTEPGLAISPTASATTVGARAVAGPFATLTATAGVQAAGDGGGSGGPMVHASAMVLALTATEQPGGGGGPDAPRPSATSAPATSTSGPAATATWMPATGLPPSATAQPTATSSNPIPSVAPTATAAAPTATRPPATATRVPSTATAAAPTSTRVPSTATPVPPTATAVPPTATAAAPTSTRLPSTATPVPPTATPWPTATDVPPTETPVPPTETPWPTAEPIPTDEYPICPPREWQCVIP